VGEVKSEVTVWALVLLALCGCGSSSVPSVSLLSHKWLEIKTGLFSLTPGQRPDSGALNDFTGELERFFTSPVGSLYQTHQPGIARPVTAISKTVERLKLALPAGDSAALRAAALEIDAAVDQLQMLDTGMSDTIQIQYFGLFFFFSLLVILSVLALWFLSRGLENAVSRERQSRIFSRETILAQEQERSRIARELHDTVAQDLWRLTFRTDSIHKADTEEERRLLCGEVAKGQRELIKRLRSICDTLVPPDFKRRGLPDALRSLCYDFSRRTGIECVITVQEGLGAQPLEADRQLQCFRIVQECLANIEKHAGANEASVLVTGGSPGTSGGGSRGPGKSPGRPVLRIQVADNGRGFRAEDTSSRPRPGAQGRLGLRNMYGRAAALGGSLQIDSKPGEGTRVTLEVPPENSSAGDGEAAP
jgi:signal transduction histidine kinase